MGNQVGNSYGLTALIPIKHGEENNQSYDKLLRDQLQTWPVGKLSPMAQVPNTYLSRVFLLNDVFYEGAPAIEEHLKNKYLVFSSNFYGDLDTYLTGMWDVLGEMLSDILRHCVAFDSIRSASDFVDYIKRCQIDNSLFFNGSNDKPLAEQLKALYVKQAFVHFTYETQKFRRQGQEGQNKLQEAFKRFTTLIKTDDLTEPSWPLGATEDPGIESKIKELVRAVEGEVR